MITLFWADGTSSLCQTLQIPLVDGTQHILLMCLPVHTNQKTPSKCWPDWYSNISWIFTCTDHAKPSSPACFMPVFSALFLYYYVTSILWHSNWKGVNRNNVKQDLYPTATTEKRQNWIQEVLAMVLLPQALVPNFFLCILLHFFSLLFTNKHTHTSFPHFVLFESK